MKNQLKMMAIIGLVVSLAPGFSGLTLPVGLQKHAKKHAKTTHAETTHAETTHVGKYPTVAMRSGKVSEDHSAGVIYFDANRREASRITIKEGLVYDHAGVLVKQTNSKKHNLNNYVMGADGTFYLFDEFTNPKVRHSSIFAGEPVAGAGNIQVSNGHIVYVDSDSGHYSATKLFSNVLKELSLHGVDVSAFSNGKH